MAAQKPEAGQSPEPWPLYRRGDRVARKNRPKRVGTAKKEGRIFPGILWPGEKHIEWVTGNELMMVEDKHPDLSKAWTDPGKEVE